MLLNADGSSPKFATDGSELFRNEITSEVLKRIPAVNTEYLVNGAKLQRHDFNASWLCIIKMVTFCT